MRTPVTTDVAVLQGWPKPKGSKKDLATSSDIAAALKLTVFQITARLKGMEGRGLVARDDRSRELWFRTEKGVAEAKNPTPQPVRAPRVHGSGGGAAGLPNDAKVKTIRADTVRWCDSDTIHQHFIEQAEDIKARLAGGQLHHDAVVDRKLRVSLKDVLRAIKPRIAAKRDGCWSTRDVWEGATVKIKDGDGKPAATQWRKHVAKVYRSPKGDEYVEAKSLETADLIVKGKGGDVRLRLYGDSDAHKRLTKKEREQNARASAKEEQRQQERQRRILQEEQHEEEQRQTEAQERKAKAKKPAATPVRTAHGQPQTSTGKSRSRARGSSARHAARGRSKKDRATGSADLRRRSKGRK